MQLEGRNLGLRYDGRWILREISITVREGERLGIIAPSGYGKTSLCKILAGYRRPTLGQVLLDGRVMDKKGVFPVQLVSQHPEQSINPRWRMREVLQEAGMLDSDALQLLGIETDWLSRYPNELSGGELQRFCVARAMCKGTRFLIADEISAMLDVITQAQIWEYLQKQAEAENMGMIVVSHSPSLLNRVCTKTVELEAINRA